MRSSATSAAQLRLVVEQIFIKAIANRVAVVGLRRDERGQRGGNRNQSSSWLPEAAQFAPTSGSAGSSCRWRRPFRWPAARAETTPAFRPAPAVPSFGSRSNSTRTLLLNSRVVRGLEGRHLGAPAASRCSARSRREPRSACRCHRDCRSVSASLARRISARTASRPRTRLCRRGATAIRWRLRWMQEFERKIRQVGRARQCRGCVRRCPSASAAPVVALGAQRRRQRVAALLRPRECPAIFDVAETRASRRHRAVR